MRRLGHAVEAREDGLRPPGQQPVEQGVEQHGEHAPRQGQRVPLQRAHPDVVPLRPHAALLVVREVGTPEPEGNVGDYALEDNRQLNKGRVLGK